jgi:hypothetical protein
VRLHVYNRNEGAGPWWKTAQWDAGRWAKGWWYLGRRHGNYAGLVFALGGESNMAQVAVTVPLVGHFAVGFRAPRKLTTGWIYQRREWGVSVGYIGHWIDLYFAYDDSMNDMADYYARKRLRPDCAHCSHYKDFHDDPVVVRPPTAKRLEDFDSLAKRFPNPEHKCITGSQVNYGSAPCSCPGYVPSKPTTTKVQEWPGWHLKGSVRTRDWLLGRMRCETTKGEPEPVVIPMPEGNYPGTLRQEHRVWKRKRWPWPSKTRSDFWIDMEVGIPTPGKGENSYDCEDDAIFGTGGASRSEAIGNVTKAALRQRERYGSDRWVPDAGWPEGIGSR